MCGGSVLCMSDLAIGARLCDCVRASVCILHA